MNVGTATFGGGTKNKVVGTGILDFKSMLALTKVLHVKGLKTNIISINQLCDDDLHVNFDKKVCSVLDKHDKCAITRTQTLANCYKMNETIEQQCKSTRAEELELWQRSLGMQIII